MFDDRRLLVDEGSRLGLKGRGSVLRYTKARALWISAAALRRTAHPLDGEPLLVGAQKRAAGLGSEFERSRRRLSGERLEIVAVDPRRPADPPDTVLSRVLQHVEIGEAYAEQARGFWQPQEEGRLNEFRAGGGFGGHGQISR